MILASHRIVTAMPSLAIAKIVATGMTFFLAMLVGTLMLDATVRPRRHTGWRWQGLLLHILVMTATFGFFLTISGSVVVAAVLVTTLMALFTISSNAKHAMLGEPLLFSDLALIAALFRHPRFYFTAIPLRQRRALMLGGPGLPICFVLLFVPRIMPHAFGFGLLLAGIAGLLLLAVGGTLAGIAREPDVEADLVRYGLVATLLLYWWRWRETPNPPARRGLTAPAGGADEPPCPEIIMVVQCESFADPVELTGDPSYALPGLARARAAAAQWGDLHVSGFGAYTMRTEYGLLFGRSEAQLGFRRYDPFLTAHGETSYALSARLATCGYRCSFVHPHDMRFYGRDRLMPAIGFRNLVGAEHFPPIPPGGGRYVNDRTLGAVLGDLANAADGPALLYAVTMENHGPWDTDALAGSMTGLDAYLGHLRSSDMMLNELIDRLEANGRSALLVFFGDHRPSIPGVTEPGGDRHTPYVMIRFDEDGRILPGDKRRADLTPHALHSAILDCVSAGRAVTGPGDILKPSVA